MKIRDVQARPLDVPLRAPFVVASTRLDTVNNASIRVTLEDGTAGWGEAPTLPPITVEDQPRVLSAVQDAAAWLPGVEAGDGLALAARLREELGDAASTRAGIEMAVADAQARVDRVPLYQYFGGASTAVRTDITIPICEPPEAEALAGEYRSRGFDTIKTKIGHDVEEDVDRLRAIRRGHPGCVLVLDANEGYTEAEARFVLRELRAASIVPGLFEQPVAREDWEGMGALAREAGVPIAADESCRSLADAERIARDGLAQVINIKLVKCGVAESLDIARCARTNGLGLMIGGMVETRLAMGFSAHFAAGLGGFDWIDLDTPYLLAEDPVRGGTRANGPEYDLSEIKAGHGASIPWP
jgi:L-alanine-DL-glutamate epimerase-like enolase superfamily enzyme